MKEALEFPTRNLKLKRPDDYQGVMRGVERLERRSKEAVIEQIENLSVERDDCEEIVEAVKSDLIRQYGRAGIAITEDDFSKVYFVPQGSQWALGCDPDMGGSYILSAGITVDFVPERNSNEMFLQLSTIHHELNHSLGRRAFIYALDASDNPYRFCGQAGLVTSSPGSSYGIQRGMSLEEGVVEYFAIKFSLSDDETVVKYRKNLAGRIRNYYGVEGMTDSEVVDKWIYQQAKVAKPEKPEDGQYVRVTGLVERLSSMAEAVGGAEAKEELESLLLASRVDSVAKSFLVDRLRKMYTHDTVGAIFSTPMLERSLGVLLDILELEEMIRDFKG